MKRTHADMSANQMLASYCYFNQLTTAVLSAAYQCWHHTTTRINQLLLLHLQLNISAGIILLQDKELNETCEKTKSENRLFFEREK